MLKIHITITRGSVLRPEVINIMGHMETSNMRPPDVVHTLYLLEKDYNMLHPEQRMHVTLDSDTVPVPSPAA